MAWNRRHGDDVLFYSALFWLWIEEGAGRCETDMGMGGSWREGKWMSRYIEVWEMMSIHNTSLSWIHLSVLTATVSIYLLYCDYDFFPFSRNTEMRNTEPPETTRLRQRALCYIGRPPS